MQLIFGYFSLFDSFATALNVLFFGLVVTGFLMLLSD